jgi:hypothetical protein
MIRLPSRCVPNDVPERLAGDTDKRRVPQVAIAITLIGTVPSSGAARHDREMIGSVVLGRIVAALRTLVDVTDLSECAGDAVAVTVIRFTL